MVKKNSAMEILFVECVEGNPYSIWWVLRVAVEWNQKMCDASSGVSGVLRRVTGGANGLGEHIKSLRTDETYTPRASTKSSALVASW